MTTAMHPDVVVRTRPDEPQGENYLTGPGKGFLSWFLTKDHKRLGVMYMTSVLTFFFIAGCFALILRTKLLSGEHSDMLKWLDRSPNPTGEGGYNTAFTLHGAIMVFLVIIPSIPAAFGNFVLPIMLGAKDVAFPRLNLFSYHLYCIGALFFISTLAFGGLDTGWTFYTPYSTNRAGGAMAGMIPATLGAFILGFSSIFTG